MAKDILYRAAEKCMPTFFYRVLGARRARLLKHFRALSIEEIKRLDDELYYQYYGRHVNWEHPVAYTEKMQVEKILRRDPMKSLLTDKYRVREWVKERIGEEYLVPLAGVYDSAYDIDFDTLPEKFVIKTNAGSGDAMIVKDKSRLSAREIRRIRARMEFYLKNDFASCSYELHYSEIEPKLVVEHLIECDEEDVPDYKFICFDGKPHYCWVDKNRYHGHTRSIYDMDWNLQPWTLKYENYDGIIDRPSNFGKMAEIAAKLAEGFRQVRVDLYSVNGRIRFGEMTFTSESGFGVITPYEMDVKLGDIWDLEMEPK